MDQSKAVEIEAAVLRRLLNHLGERTDVQNIDLMNLAGFCRNCLSRWYVEEAANRSVTIDKDDARARVYGMPYADWKTLYQTDATPAQQAAFSQQAAKDRDPGSD